MVAPTRRPEPAFWSGKRVFLTGHTGFKGSWLLVWLAQLGAHVRGFALAPVTTPSMFGALNLAQLCEHIVGDVTNGRAIEAAMTEFRPDVVLHLAAQPLVRESYRRPIETFATNVMGTANTLEACRRCPSVQSVVVVSSDKCYEDREWAWPYREADRIGGHDPYSASKACAELVTASYRASFLSSTERSASSPRPFAISTARAGNVLGGGDWSAERLLPDAVKALNAGRPLLVRMPDAVRPWQHVVEPLAGYLLLSQALAERGENVESAFNFGPPPEAVRPVHEILDRFFVEWGSGAQWVASAPSEGMHESSVLRLDSSLARARLGWRPAFGVDTVVSAAVEWYRAYYAGAGEVAMHQLTARQIRSAYGSQ